MYCHFECVFSELAQLLPTSVPSLISHLLVSQLLHEFCINMLEFVYLFADLPALERAKCCFTATHSHIQALGTLSKIIWLKQLSIHICVCVRMYLAQRLLSWHSVACLSSTLQSKLSIFYLFFHTFLLTGQLRATDIDFFFFFFIFFCFWFHLEVAKSFIIFTHKTRQDGTDIQLHISSYKCISDVLLLR